MKDLIHFPDFPNMADAIHTNKTVLLCWSFLI